VCPSASTMPSGPMRPGNHGWATPAAAQLATTSANSAVCVVKNCAPCRHAAAYIATLVEHDDFVVARKGACRGKPCQTRPDDDESFHRYCFGHRCALLTDITLDVSLKTPVQALAPRRRPLARSGAVA